MNTCVTDGKQGSFTLLDITQLQRHGGLRLEAGAFYTN
jgi:hypothetical protein